MVIRVRIDGESNLTIATTASPPKRRPPKIWYITSNESRHVLTGATASAIQTTRQILGAPWLMKPSIRLRLTRVHDVKRVIVAVVTMLDDGIAIVTIRIIRRFRTR
jgi:hypothetical protein